MFQLQGLIFDLEGTLLDGAVDLRQALNMLLNEHGRPVQSLDAVKTMMTNGSMQLVQRAFESTGGMPGKDVFPFVQKFIKYYHEVKADPAQIYPHVIQTLEKYFNAGVKLGICTNKQEAATYKVLKELGLFRYFEFIAGGDTFPVHKPNPEHVYGVITALDVPKDGCVFVGDGPNDIRAARGAKIPCVLVTQSYGEDEARPQGADEVIGDLGDLEMALSKLGYL